MHGSGCNGTLARAALARRFFHVEAWYLATVEHITMHVGGSMVEL
jgi:hypothetical protein